MNEQAKNFGIKIVLTIPALLMGILSLILFILKPLIDLWCPSIEPDPTIPQVSQLESPHEFH